MNLLDYNEYVIEEILESIKNDETILILSENLRSYLVSVKHPIAEKIVLDSNIADGNATFKITFLDIVDGKKDKDGNNILDIISFVQSKKAIEAVAKNKDIPITQGEEIEYWNTRSIKHEMVYDNDKYFRTKSKSETSLGKIVNKLYPDMYKASGESGQDIESFVNEFKALRNPIQIFELVNGEDINYWYHENRYSEPKAGSLWGSCMRHSYTNSYMNFYSENPDKVSLLILKNPDDETKIIGRAIVWKVDKLDGFEFEGDRFFMDRIYYNNDYIVNLFKRYAIENDWLYKAHQNMDEDEDFIDEKNGIEYKTILITDIADPGNGSYPFMDTMKFFNISSNELSNNNYEVGDAITLTNTDGSADGIGTWSEFYDEYIDTSDEYIFYCDKGEDYRKEEDCFYSEKYSCMVANDYAEDNGVYCDYQENDEDSWREVGDYEETEGGTTATEKYAQNNWYYSDYTGEWLEEGEWSEYHSTYLNPDNSVQVYTDVSKDSTDYRSNDDGSFWTWDYDNEYYDNDVTEDELKEENGLDDEDEDEDSE